MAAWTKMVSVELTDEEKLDTLGGCPPNIKNAPEYPWGLRISFDSGTLEKLGLEEDPDVGDYIDLRAFARVTCCSREQRGDGTFSRRIELQIEQLAVEDESTEEPAEE